MILPYELDERPTSGTNAEWVDVKRRDTLPDREQVDVLGDWTYEAGAIKLVGATASRDVRLNYERELTALTGNSSPLLIPGSQDCVASYAAVYAARSRTQEELAKQLEKIGNDEFDDLANSFSKGNQAVSGRRRRGYRSTT